ncbi:MAG: acyl-CoA dehydrogenase, partial [Alphaproteobacteria bacterium]
MADPTATAALSPSPDGVLIDDLLPTCRAALSAADSLIATARGAVNQVVSAGGRVDAAKLDANQFA